MRQREGILLIGVAASLVLAVTPWFSRQGSREVSEPASAPVDAPASESPPPQRSRFESSENHHGPGAASTADRARVAKELAGDEGLTSSADRRREARELEAKYLAEYALLREEQGVAALESSVRAALSAGHAPLAQRAAGLRALHESRIAGLDLLLRSIVEQQPDVSDGVTSSLPSAALKLLFERAASGEDARRQLARLAFVPNERVSADLRRRASTALSASIPSPQRGEVERLLRLEMSAQQLDAALEELSRDANFSTAQHE